MIRGRKQGGRLKRLMLATMATLGDWLRRTPIAHWQWLRQLHGKLTVSLSESGEVTVGQFRVSVDPRDRVIAKKLILYGGFETREIELLCSFVKPGDCVLDVGANIGLYSLALSGAVGPSGRVVAIEPDPDNLALLHKNLRANGCTNVTVIPHALGDESKIVLLYQSDDNRGALSINDFNDGGAERAISVRMRRGDSVMAEMGLSARIAKIDVESSEPLVIAGLGIQLPEVLLFEFAPSDLRTSGHDPLEFLQNLVAAGYTLAIVDPDTGQHPIMTAQEIQRLAAAAQMECNILALRDESTTRFSGSGPEAARCWRHECPEGIAAEVPKQNDNGDDHLRHHILQSPATRHELHQENVKQEANPRYEQESIRSRPMRAGALKREPVVENVVEDSANNEPQAGTERR